MEEVAADAAEPVRALVPAPAADRQALEQLAGVFERLYNEGGEGLYERIERVLVQSAYTFCQNNQVHTAELLGITRNVLRTQLKRFGLLAGAKAPSNDEGDVHDTIDSPGLSARSIATV